MPISAVTDGLIEVQDRAPIVALPPPGAAAESHLCAGAGGKALPGSPRWSGDSCHRTAAAAFRSGPRAFRRRAYEARCSMLQDSTRSDLDESATFLVDAPARARNLAPQPEGRWA